MSIMVTSLVATMSRYFLNTFLKCIYLKKKILGGGVFLFVY